jgi:hypothetical protein
VDERRIADAWEQRAMTDPRCNQTRLSLALRHAGERGQATKHELMLRAAGAIGDVERTLGIIWIALERGDLELAKLRLKHIENVLGCEGIVINREYTSVYQHNKKRNISTNAN